MDLQVSLPQIVEGDRTEVETRPGKLATWLSSLPLLNLAETSQKVFQSLSATNRSRLDDKDRLKLLETYRESVATLCAELEKEFIGQSLPLPQKALLAASRARGFQIEMAYGYKFLTKTLAENINGKIKDKVASQLALSTQRAIFYLANSLYYSYISYHPPVPGVWREIHRLYDFAATLQANDIEVEDHLVAPKGQSSVTAVYKKALLLDLSGPYHLPARSVKNIYQCLNTWGSLATLSTAEDLPKMGCQFLLDRTRDSAGEVYDNGQINKSNIKQYQILNTLELARHVHSRLKTVKAGQVPEENGVKHGIYTEENTKEFLTRLVNAWGVNPKRSFRRVSKKGDEIDIAIGVESINLWLNGGERLVLSSEFVGPMPQKKKFGTYYLKETDSPDISLPDQMQNNPELAIIVWNVIDESAGGLALSCKKAGQHKIKVGDILSLRTGKDGHWEIAVVRWIKNTDVDTVSIGVQRMAPDAVAVAINVVNEEGKDTGYKPALLLPAMPALKQPPTIVAEKSTLQHGQAFFMDNGFQLNEAKAVRVTESTTAFERFEFSIVQTR